MNLEERIESAWKEHWNSSGLHAGESFTDFRSGYLTAMRSLYMEVKMNCGLWCVRRADASFKLRRKVKMLTNDDIASLKEFCAKSYLPILNDLAIAAFDELIQYHATRDAGDEEVEDLAGNASRGIGLNWYWNREDCVKASECLKKLKLVSIARVQQLEQLQVQLAGCLCAAEGSTGAPVAKQGDYGWSLAYQKTLELHQQLREAREEIEGLKKRVEAENGFAIKAGKMIDELAAERDAAREEFAELRSAPGMEDVAALVGDFTVEECDQPCLTTWMQRNKKLADIARRAIASREEEKQRADEVAGLLKWWVSFKDGFGQLEGMSAGSAVEEWKDNARRILEIVEGK